VGSDDVRIAVVGPTHPHTGGIVHHTTELCHRLAAAGHDVQDDARKSLTK